MASDIEGGCSPATSPTTARHFTAPYTTSGTRPGARDEEGELLLNVLMLVGDKKVLHSWRKGRWVQWEPSHSANLILREVLGVPQVCTVDAGTGRRGTHEICISEISVLEVCGTQLGKFKCSASQLGSQELGPVREDSAKHRSFKIRVYESCETKVCIHQCGCGQVQACEIHASEVAALEIHTAILRVELVVPTTNDCQRSFYRRPSTRIPQGRRVIVCKVSWCISPDECRKCFDDRPVVLLGFLSDPFQRIDAP